MKMCPICHIEKCHHERKFYLFSLTKILIVQKSLETTVLLFSKLMTCMPFGNDINYKLSATGEDLKKCQDRVNEMRKWMENKTADGAT